MQAARCLLIAACIAASPGLAARECSRDAGARAAMQRMDGLINAGSGAAALESYLSVFDPAVKAWGLYEDGAADFARVRQHYTPVFGGFKDSILVSEETIVAGDMAAQRYHALFRLDGVFDGVEAHDRLTAIRGQTFFRFGPQGRIAERWSNHDHAFRMSQLLGEAGAIEGERLARVLNGPGLGEIAVYDALETWREAFNRIETPDVRAVAVAALLAPGLLAEGKSRTEFLGRLDAFWRAVPDAVLHYDTRLSAWSMGAVRWRLGGSLRADFEGRAATHQPVWLQGESIVRFGNDGRVEQIWNGCIRWQGVSPAAATGG